MPGLAPGESLRRLFSPILPLATRLAGRESPWERVPMHVPVTAFGQGSRQPFAAYFEGSSRVSVLRPRSGFLSVETARISGKIFGTPLADTEGVSLDIATGPNFENVRQARVRYHDCRSGF